MKESDLSSEIAQAVTRKSDEQVTCRRITTNYYRCNWWTLRNTTSYDNPAMSGSLVTTSRISRSQFVRAVKSGEELSITAVSADGSEHALA